jgi:hypothetical protein
MYKNKNRPHVLQTGSNKYLLSEYIHTEQMPAEEKKSQHGCVRWALREHLTPLCSDFACGGLEDCHQKNIKYHKKLNMYF